MNYFERWAKEGAEDERRHRIFLHLCAASAFCFGVSAVARLLDLILNG